MTDHEQALEYAVAEHRPLTIYWRFPSFFPIQWVAGWVRYNWRALPEEYRACSQSM